MSYEPTVWKDGDLVTSAKLNKLEQGVANGGGVLVVHADDNGKLDRTWQEIYDADFAVLQVIEDDEKAIAQIGVIGVENNNYYIRLDGFAQTFSASAPDDYPEAGGGSR